MCIRDRTGQKAPNTTIMKEYSCAYEDPDRQIPYYAILNDENRAHYERYKALTESLPNFHLIGRLAEYKYYNMDKIVLNALELSSELVAEATGVSLLEASAGVDGATGASEVV